MSVENTVEIVQADRDAAASWWRTQKDCAGVEHILEGLEGETELVQAFARHRQTALSDIEAVIEPLLLFHESGRHEGDGSDERLAVIRAALQGRG